MSSVLQELKSLHTKMDEMKVALNTKIDGMKTSFEKQLNAKVDNLRDSLEKLVTENRDCLKAELAQRTKEIQENLDMEIGHMVARLEQVEARINRAGSKENTPYDPDVSIIIFGLRYEEGEDVTELVKELLTEGLQWDSPHGIVAAERLRERGGRPGVIKVELGSVQDKVDVLRKKQGLKSNEKFQSVYICS
ncbi:hypothetical protein ABVT39_025537 [Epinephelus coioides]